MKKSPKALLHTTTTTQIQVFMRAASLYRSSVAGTGGRGRRFRGCVRGSLVRGHEFFPFGPQGHIFPGFFRKPPALVAVEYGLPHDAPDHARAEKILAVKPLHPFHQF